VQLLDWTASKTSAVGRLLLVSGLGGVLAAAMVLPVVAATGIAVRNTSDKFSTLSLTPSGLPQRSEIYDRTGGLITTVYGVDLGSQMRYAGLNRQPVGYNQISPYMIQAIVAIEDDRYWTHGAIDVKGTLRALVNDLRHQPVQGGSTIAQQYVKGVLLLQAYPNKAAQEAVTAENLNRKLNERRMAVQAEHKLSKQTILAGYLNDAYFSHGAWGVEAAAETYFGTTAAKLTLVQAATLAGIVENPTKYDPIANPTMSQQRRNTVLARIQQTNPVATTRAAPRLTAAVALAAERQKLVLHPDAVQSGCTANTVGNAAFFCDYVIHTILLDKTFGATAQDRAKRLATGGLKIYTTLSPQDQSAATKAVNYVLPAHSHTYNPAKNADTEVLMQPGTGKVTAIAEDRHYGTGKGQTEVNYAVNTAYGGQQGVQTGSSSKLFTLITALKQGIPFGFQMTVHSPDEVGGFTNCDGQPTGVDPKTNQIGVFPVTNSEGPGQGAYSLYTGTTQSINVFYAHLEQKVGLCNVVHTAVDLGVTRVDGTSLLDWGGAYRDKKTHKIKHRLPPADDLPTFTLGAVNVSPMSMAAAYATVASGGIYCKPIVLSKVIDSAGQTIPVPKAGCHRALDQDVAAGVNYILQGVLINGTAGGMGLANYQAAGKTGTSNVETNAENRFGTPFAAFGGYTTNLVGYVSVFNPVSPEIYPMANESACYRLEGGGQNCPPEMFGADAPATTWHMTFDNANLSGSHDFAQVSQSSELWSQGDGQHVKQPPKKKPRSGGGGGGGGGGGTGGGGGGRGGGGGGPPAIRP
jgi:membrane peptidoglycan carboxypeptidase